MLTAIKEIGELLLKKENKDPVDILIENPNSNGNYKIVYILKFDNNFTFNCIEVEEFKGEKPYLYLYKRASGSNAPDFSPTSKVTEPEKTFKKKILRWFENHQKNEILEKLYKELKINEKSIIKKLIELNKQSKDGKIISVKFEDKYLYDIPIFKEILLNDYLAKVREIYRENAFCSICGEKKSIVFTTSQIYRFYSYDKECYIASGLNKKYAWKNFPICEDCFLKIDFGRKFVEKSLKFKFYSKSYYLIPKLILSSQDALEEINEILSLGADSGKIKLTSEIKKRLTDDENEILEVLKDYRDIISFYLLFLKGGSTADSDRILLLVEDVLPSRINFIFNSAKSVEKDFNREYNFGRLNKFLSKFDKLFFEVIDKIFKGGILNFNSLLQIFNRKIRDDFLNKYEDFKFDVIDALMNLRFFELLSLIKFEESIMEKTKFDKLFNKLGNALNSPAKRGIFLLGALTQMLLNIQGQERGSTPFLKNLKGLKMNEEDIKGLLPKVINKLMEYDRFDSGKKEIAEEIVKNLLSQEKFGLSIDEINFYFASGMAISKEVADMVYENEEQSQTV